MYKTYQNDLQYQPNTWNKVVSQLVSQQYKTTVYILYIAYTYSFRAEAGNTFQLSCNC